MKILTTDNWSMRKRKTEKSERTFFSILAIWTEVYAINSGLNLSKIVFNIRLDSHFVQRLQENKILIMGSKPEIMQGYMASFWGSGSQHLSLRHANEGKNWADCISLKCWENVKIACKKWDFSIFFRVFRVFFVNLGI